MPCPQSRTTAHGVERGSLEDRRQVVPRSVSLVILVTNVDGVAFCVQKGGEPYFDVRWKCREQAIQKQTRELVIVLLPCAQLTVLTGMTMPGIS